MTKFHRMHRMNIPDFAEIEISIAQSALDQRYGPGVKIEIADSELRLDPEAPVLTTCPTLYWQALDCHFVVFKVGTGRYRCQFFYGVREQFGTGRTEYDDLPACVLDLLRAQADHDKDRKGARSGLTGDQLR